MTPIKLKLANFCGILAGLGKQEIEIDFDEIVPADSQIVALVGPNGAGKTTILDNMHPYRVMPSRASSMSPEGFSYYDHVLPESDALKELEWSHQGWRFRSVIRIRSLKKTRKQECYLLVLDEDGNAMPYAGRDGLVSNGSTENYDRCVQEVLGAPEVFFTAQFGSQGRKPLSSMRVSEIKTLLSAMLRFDRYAKAHAKTKSVCDAIKGTLVSLQRTKQEQSSALVQARSEASALDQLRQQRQDLVVRLEAQSQAIVQAERAHAVVQDRLQQQATIRLQRTSVQSRLEAAQRHASQVEEAFDRETLALNGSFATSLRHAQEAEQLSSRAALDAEQRLQELQTLCNKRESIDAARQKLVGLRDRLGQLRMQKDELGYKPDLVASMRENLNKLREQLVGDMAGVKNLADLIETMRRTASIVEEVPCQGTELAGGCKLLAQGMKAADELPGTEDQFAALNRTCASIKVQGMQEKSRLEELLLAEERDRSISQTILSIELEMANLKALLGEEERVKDAVKQVPVQQELLNQARQRLVEASAAVQAEMQRAVQWRDERARAKVQQLNVATQTVAALRQELASMPALVATVDVDTAREAIEAERTALNDLAMRQTALEAHIRNAEGSAARVTELELACRLSERREQAYSNALALWNLLLLALSKNGILSMELDDANPAIAAHTNALLDECYGGRFSVRLLTQKATATGVLKEDFEVLVHDNFRGGDAKPLDLMSGGEKVWINECLMRGIALYTSVLEGKTGGVLFSDETDGPLDEGRKRQFLDMKRACLRMGGYERDYVITHTQELWDMCDARIDVALL